MEVRGGGEEERRKVWVVGLVEFEDGVVGL